MRYFKQVCLLCFSIILTGCGSSYTEFSAPEDMVIPQGSMLTIDGDSLGDYVFIPNQVTNVELEVVAFVWVNNQKNEVKDVTLSAQVMLNSVISRADIRSVALVDKKGISFPLKSFLVDSDGKAGISVDCKDGCATYKIDMDNDLNFIVQSGANISGFNAMKKDQEN